MKDKLIRDTDFCHIVTDKFEKEQGIKFGQRVYIAGHRAFPVSEEDPYTQRVKFFVHLINKSGCVELPALYVMDPSSLKKVGKKEAKKLQEQFNLDFNTEEVPADGATIH